MLMMLSSIDMFASCMAQGSLLCLPGVSDDSDDEEDGEMSVWYVNARGPSKKNEKTVQCGPVKLIANHYSVPIQWLNLKELTDEYAIFEVWPTEQDRIPATHLLDMPDLKWEKEEEGKFYMTREQYDLGNEQL